jgi:hypothetical protein
MHRFDDPDRSFRTLYCAERRETAFREVLADLRPNSTARLDFERRFGPRGPSLVTTKFRSDKSLARGVLRVASGDLLDIDDPSLRDQFERLHAKLLAEHGMDHFDISHARGKDRPITQAFTRFLAERGAAGVAYRSNLDDLACAALFENRASLDPVPGCVPEPLTASIPDLVKVCAQWGLVLQD